MNRKQRRADKSLGKSAPAGGSPELRQVFALAVQHHQAGRLAEADQNYRKVLAADPRHSDSLHMLGVLACQTKHPDIAVDLIQRAVAINGGNAAYHHNLGSAWNDLGRLDEAIASFRRAVGLKPDYVKALHNLGHALRDQGRRDDAALAFRQALKVNPNDLGALGNLGLLLQDAGQAEEAVACYRQLLGLRPDYPEAHNNLGNALRALGRWDEALASYRQAIALKPGFADVHNNLGAALRDRGHLDEAVACFHRARELQPDRAAFRESLAAAYASQGGALRADARLEEALVSYRQALDHKPDFAEVHNESGNALANLGRLDEAVLAYRQAIAARPGYMDARSNLLMTLHSLADVSAADILAEARAFAGQVETGAVRPSYQSQADPMRKLRIGYVSADFRTHPVGFFLDRVLGAHDRAEVEIHCYSNSAFADEMTERLRGAADQWRSIAGVPDADAGAMIRGDGIDILVDLAGHTGDNRLPLFATRPAPVQASWLGYFGTTGLSAIDYLLADACVAPPDEDHTFTEAVRRLPGCYLCYSPPELHVPTAPFPGIASGFVTFGSFNNRAKIGPETVAAWAAILARTASSRLLLKSWAFGDPAGQASLRAQFADHGIDPDRLIMEGLSPRAEGLAAYNRVDVALDPFPFGGCTTTADTLWMGVPLVTQRGARWSGRMSHTILATMGLEEWVAKNMGDYIELACRLAADLPSLAPVRADLRRRLEASAFCDGPGFTRNLEAAYREMWATWCGRTD